MGHRHRRRCPIPLAGREASLGRCELTLAQAKSILAEVADAAAAAANELDTFSDYDDAHASDTPEQMRQAWREGVASLGS